MPELERLRAEHAAAVLEFELANRDYFAASITDRGDEFFAHFSERYNALLSEQQNGLGAYYVLVAHDGPILGRVNLRFVDDFGAELGYRIAQHTAGQGLATAAVSELCRLAWSQYGLRSIRAAVSVQNTASRRVLSKAGFVLVRPADPADLGGKPGAWYERILVDG